MKLDGTTVTVTTAQAGRTGCGVSYTVRGSGPPVLWMSGYVVPVAAFDEVIDLVAENFTVIAVDHRGSGVSRTRMLPTTTGTMAADAVSVLDRLGLDSAHVVGTSLGGMVAQELAIAWPHRVRSLVLCSTTAGGAGAKTPPLRDVVFELNRTALRVPGARFRVGLMGVLHQAAAASTHDATQRLHRIKVPTLVLHGREDGLVPMSNATWLASRIPGAQLRMVRRGTHLLVLESHVAREELSAWLTEHSSQPPTVGPPGARARFTSLLETPYRVLLGQSLPLRRVVRAGSRRVRRPSPRRGPGRR